VSTQPLMDAFLDDLAETLEAEGQLLVGHFFWILRGIESGLTPEHMQQLSQEAYAVVRRRYQTRLVWVTWPTDLETARAADDAAPLDFDLDQDSPLDTPHLCLVLSS
jgi:hypothetical protein